MKKFFFSIAILGSIASCTEIPLPYDQSKGSLKDTTYVGSVETPQLRSILVEKSTGVQCNNCPKGDAAIKLFDSIYPNRIVAVGIHNGFLANPHKAGEDTLKTQFGEDIITYLGFQAQPSAGINRRKFDSQPNLLVALPFWKNLVDSQLTTPTPINLSLGQISYNTANRTVTFAITGKFTQPVSGALNVSVMVVEDKIEAEQKMPDGTYNATYEQEHVLRTMFTPALGTPLNLPDQNAGRVFTKVYEEQLPAKVKPENAKLVVFVHRSSPGQTEVLQAIQAKIK
jgi:hypothetical protein